MSSWTHAICRSCWDDRYLGREPTRLRDAELETCCTCGILTVSGIYVRQDPKTMTCQHARAVKSA